MRRVALSCSEPIRPEMAGIGVRYMEFARRLAGGIAEIVLVTSGDPGDVPSMPPNVEVRRFRAGSIGVDLRDCDAVVVQGGLADRVVAEVGDMPVAVDLYDPWLVENLHYFPELGSAPYRRDHHSWALQLARGDFFLCSSEPQRAFYLGWLAAVGRLRPELLAEDPTLSSLLGLVPFGIDAELPEHRPVLPEREADERRILFGGLYDWLDPWPVLEALELLDRPDWRLLLVGNPNPTTTPQRLWRQVQSWCRERGWWGDRVRAIEWIPADRRFDLFRDVDALVVSHRDGPETWLSLRTRVIEAIAAACPVVISDGGGVADLMRRYGVGTVVPGADRDLWAAALREALESEAEDPSSAREAMMASMSWERTLRPLARFCRDPWRHPTSQTPEPDSAVRRVLRRVGRAASRDRW